MKDSLRPVIVGAGPAGIRAAEALVAHGVRPVLLDEASRGGGQIYRRAPKQFGRGSRTLYGFEAARADAVHAALDRMASAASIDYRPDTLVWNAAGHQLDTLHGPTRSGRTVPYTQLIVATGATDRVLPVPGWTLPGVTTLGGAQVALKFQGCATGRRVVLMGSGPLLYLVAYQYAKAGAGVAAVLDTALRTDQIAATGSLARQPATWLKGMYYVAWLKSHGVALHTGIKPLEVLGNDRVQGVAWETRGKRMELACDAVALGHALRSETQLADVLGCEFVFDAGQRAHLPRRDAPGRASVPGVYLAGDGAGIMGADAAEWAGERAALALLADAGLAIDTARASTLERQLAGIAAFRTGLERAFPFPHAWAAQAPDDLVVCRCENVTAGEVRATARRDGSDDINRVKALCRVGMGRCQGRMCGTAAIELLAHARSVPVQVVGRLRTQAPIKPIPMLMSLHADALAEPADSPVQETLQQRVARAVP